VGQIVKAAGALALLAMVAAGCGGDDSTAAKDTTTTGEDTTTTASDDGGSDASGLAGVLDKDCQFLLTGSYLNPLASATAGKSDDVENASNYLDELSDAAPDEIKDDLKTVAEAIGKISEALKSVDTSNPQAAYTDPDFQAALQELQDPDYTAAAKNVGDWITENCGVGK